MNFFFTPQRSQLTRIRTHNRVCIAVSPSPQRHPRSAIPAAPSPQRHPCSAVPAAPSRSAAISVAQPTLRPLYLSMRAAWIVQLSQHVVVGRVAVE